MWFLVIVFSIQIFLQLFVRHISEKSLVLQFKQLGLAFRFLLREKYVKISVFCSYELLSDLIPIFFFYIYINRYIYSLVSENCNLQRISIIFSLISSIEYDVYFRHIDLYIYCKIDLRDFCEVFAPKVPIMSQTCSFCLISKGRDKKSPSSLFMRREQDSNLRGNFVAYTLSRCVTVGCNYSDFQ